jgi:hypothetical protein
MPLVCDLELTIPTRVPNSAEESGRHQTAGSAGGRSLCWVRRGDVSQTRRVWRLRQIRRVEYLALLHKLGVERRAQAVAVAARHGLL